MARPGARPHPRKFQPLADYLATQEEEAVRLTLAEIEALIGSPLPVSASVNTHYWRGMTWPVARPLSASGWEAVRLDRRGQAVVFRRLAKESVMVQHHESGTWPYRGFALRYHRLADPATTTDADTPWWAEIIEAPEIPPISGDTYALAQAAAEQAIDDFLAHGGHQPPAPRHRALRGRNHRITAYLATRPVTEQSVVLSFAALEALLGGALPKSARQEGRYWTHLRYRHVRDWTLHGWRAQLRTSEQTVVFTRTVQEKV